MVEARRGVTRSYVLGLLGACVTVAGACVVAAWGMIGFFFKRQPIDTPDIPVWVGVLIVALGLILLALLLWHHALVLLRGRLGPKWSVVIGAGAGMYLLWGVLGMLFGLSVTETWQSPFAVSTAVIWAFDVLLFWALLARRVYTDLPTPQWPWERKEEEG